MTVPADELLFDGKLPLLHRRRLRVGLHSLRRKVVHGVGTPGPHEGGTERSDSPA